MNKEGSTKQEEIQNDIVKERLEKRELWINSEIDSNITEKATMYIHKWNQFDDESGIVVEKRKPIKVYINSVGGDVHDGFGLCSQMIRSKTPVHTYNIGYCYSMGFLIFIAGHKRYADELSDFLNHAFWKSTGYVKAHDYIQDGAWAMKIMKLMKRYIKSRTKMSQKQIDNDFKVDHWFDADEAVRLGVADKVIRVL